MDDISKINEALQSFKNTYGLLGAGFGAALLLMIYFLFKYLTKKIEKNAETSQDMLFHRFKTALDLELQRVMIQYSTTFERTGKAIELLYPKIYHLGNTLKQMLGPQYVDSDLANQEELNKLYENKKDLMETFGPNRVFLPESICTDIDHFITKIDQLSNDYKKGLLAPGSELHGIMDGKDIVVGGFWKAEKIDQMMIEYEQLQNDLERAFRNIGKSIAV
jgi:hypothetical protein